MRNSIATGEMVTTDYLYHVSIIIHGDVLIGGAWHLCDAHVFVHIEPLRVVVHFVGLQSDTGREPKCLVDLYLISMYMLGCTTFLQKCHGLSGL